MAMTPVTVRFQTVKYEASARVAIRMMLKGTSWAFHPLESLLNVFEGKLSLPPPPRYS